MSEEEAVRIVERKPIEGEGFIVLEGFPDVGLVGTIAASFLAEKLGMSEVGYIESEALPPVVAVKGGRILELIRIYRKDHLLTLISDVPIPLPIIRPLSQKLMEWAESKGVKMFVSLSGMPEPARLNIDRPKVYVLGSSSRVSEEALRAGKVEAFTEGYVAGVKGLLLREGVRRNIDTLLVLAQAHFNYPDPGSAAEVIRYISKLLNIDVDIQPLLESAEELKLRLRDLMRRTSQAMQSVQKSRELELPAVYL